MGRGRGREGKEGEEYFDSMDDREPDLINYEIKCTRFIMKLFNKYVQLSSNNIMRLFSKCTQLYFSSN